MLSGRRRKAFIILLGGLSIIFLLTVTSGSDFRHPFLASLANPPTYNKIREQERALPQHNLDLPYPEGRHGRYVKFSTQIERVGWNNVLNELLLCAHVAWRARRGYVFQDYGWKVEFYPWQVPDGVIPHSPLSALIGGPIVGDPWDEGDDTPRSISAEWWETVCPPEDRDVIGTDFGKKPVLWSDAQEVADHWVNLISESPKRCVEVIRGPSGEDSYPQLFDMWLITGPRSLNIFEEFRNSPVSKLLKPSSLVESGIKRNENLFKPKSNRAVPVYDRMMAVHIRRGDFIGHCRGLADWGSGFYGWNLLPLHPDPFTPPPPGSGEAGEAIVMPRCLPTEDELMDKIERSKQEWESEGALQGKSRQLDVMYVMTNADHGWVKSFSSSLKKNGWKTIVTSPDLRLNNEQLGVSMAIDMELGRRAAVFIGNGWSSMTSNIVHTRLVDHRQSIDTRFW